MLEFPSDDSSAFLTDMQSPRSLAELTLVWCTEEIRTDFNSRREASSNEDLRRALREVNREATKAASVALLQAAAAELNGTEHDRLRSIASLIDDETAITELEQRLGTRQSGGDSPQQRAGAVGQTFKDWLNEQLEPETLPERMQRWLDRGWPDTRVRAGVTTFYQAFCGALQRRLRQDSETWESLMNKETMSVEAPTWRQWLIREAEAGVPVGRKSSASKALRGIALTALFTALAGGAAW